MHEDVLRLVARPVAVELVAEKHKPVLLESLEFSEEVAFTFKDGGVLFVVGSGRAEIIYNNRPLVIGN